MAAARQHNVSVPDVDVLVGGIRTLLGALETVRRSGGPAELPPALVDVCRDVVAAHDGATVKMRPKPDPATSARARHPVRIDRDDAVREMPLRRLLWQVLEPGTTFTVGEVVTALEALGADVDAARVSNALGYWTAPSRNRLQRERKGLYYFPLDTRAEPVSPDHPLTPGDFPEPGHLDRSDGHDHRPLQAGRGKESHRGQARPQTEGARQAG